jgi:hypothetical protein
MGERQNGNGVPGRRRAHPATGSGETGTAGSTGTGGAGSGSAGAGDTLALEALLGAAMRGGRIDAEAEQRAVDAFRAARDAGVHGARTRRRDDWRPRDQRRGARSVKATLSVILASLTLGGVAFAAIGTGGSGTDGADGTENGSSRPHPSASTEGQLRAPTPSPDSGASGVPSDRPATAKDIQAHCRAYEQVAGNGKALGSTAWQRLVTAAGGEAKVRAYCAGQLAEATAESKPKTPAKSTKAATRPTQPEKPTQPELPDPTRPGKPDSTGAAVDNGQQAGKPSGGKK